MNKRELISKGMEIKPTIQVGKSGLTDKIRQEIRDQLEKRELIKIKFLGSMGPSRYWKDDLKEIVDSLTAEFIEIRGRTALVYRRSSGKK